MIQRPSSLLLFPVILSILFGGACTLGHHSGSASGADTGADTVADSTVTETTTPPSAPAGSTASSKTGGDESDSSGEEEEAQVQPWDFSPYKVLVWVVSDDPSINAESLQTPLRQYLDRDFSSLWRVSFADAPSSVSAASWRGLSSLTYNAIAASDPVIAVKRDDKDIIRIRVASNVAEYIQRIPSTAGLITDVVRRGEEAGHSDLGGVKDNLKAIDTDLLGITERWTDTATQAILIPRGLALTLDEPKAKIIQLPITQLVSSAVDTYDKIYIVRVSTLSTERSVSVIEFETLMRSFGMPLTQTFTNLTDLPFVIGHTITEVFSPVVRIDEAGQKSVKGLVRASGLIMDPESPGKVNLGDVLQPMVRKDDRSGKPLIVGRLDWAYLLSVADPVARDDVFQIGNKPLFKGEVLSNDTDDDVGDNLSVVRVNVERAAVGRVHEIKENEEDEKVLATVTFTNLEKGQFTFTPLEGFPGQVSFDYTVSDGYGNTDVATVWLGQEKPDVDTSEPVPSKASQRQVKMMFYSGRPGGLQGRQNKRTYKMALKVKPRSESTMLRLHAKGDPDFPLIGYEIYQKELTSKSMEFIGRTDWGGRISIAKTDDPLRLMYVKNGGAVLARLPMIPGLTQMEVADLTGDDMRLQAEAYIRGVQNAIVDLVAIRKLIAARVKLRLQKGQMEEAEELVLAMREQPSSKTLADDMGFKLPAFLKVIDNPNQRAKVDNMFSVTRELLTKQLNPKDLRDVEEMLLSAKKNGGKLPPENNQTPEYDAGANVISDDE